MPNNITFKITPDYTKYFNINRLYSYDNMHMFVLIGGRGIGKTTGVLIKAVQDYIKSGNEFVYVRRYKTENKKAQGVLSPIVNDVKIAGLGPGAFEYQIHKKRIGFGLTLTTQQTLKSGIDFSNVHTLIFDEAILKRGGAYRYIPDEIEALFELISTIFRTRKDYKIFIIGNNADIFNPYFDYFNVPRLDGETNIYMDSKRGLYCEMCKNKAELMEEERETPLFRLTEGTNYGEYHYNNAVLSSEVGTIGPKDMHAYLIGRIVYNGITLNIYRQKILQIYVELRDKAIKDSIAYVIMENNNPNYLYIREFRKSSFGALVERCFYNNGVVYSEQKAISVMAEVMENL